MHLLTMELFLPEGYKTLAGKVDPPPAAAAAWEEARKMDAVKLAMFDLDGTLITSKSGKRWAENADDVAFLPAARAYLRKHFPPSAIPPVVVTNQKELGGKTREACQKKLRLAARELGVIIFAAPGAGSMFRKPSVDSLCFIKLVLGLSNMKPSFFCGDAAGSEADWPPYRWGSADVEYASTIQSAFITPRELFGSTGVELVLPHFGAASENNTNIRARPLLILLVGAPGAGKSTFAGSLISGWISQEEARAADPLRQLIPPFHVEQDALKKKAKEAPGLAESTLGAGRDCIVDATHGTFTSRQPYYELARKLNCECVVVHCLRPGRPFNQNRPSPVPEVAYASYSRRFEDPFQDPPRVPNVIRDIIAVE